MNRPLCVAIPAWGEPYVALALRYTVPAILASIDAWDRSAVASFVVHTDDKRAFRKALGRHRADFRTPKRGPGNPHEANWRAFERAHREALTLAPNGSLLIMLNADTVVSRETVAVVDQVLRGRAKVGAAVGLRTLIERDPPPVGASASALGAWTWRHRHPIVRELEWTRGRSAVPTMLFFPHDDGAVSMHCFHQTPMFIVKDRTAEFSTTIDDDLLESYAPDERVYFGFDSFAIAELSPATKMHGVEGPLTVDAILRFCNHNMRRSHLEHFRRRLAIVGRPSSNHPAADRIMARLGEVAVRS